MKTLVYAEHDNASLKDATLAVVTAAGQLGEVHVLVAGNACDSAVQAAAKVTGVATVLVANDAAFANQLAENVAPLVAGLMAGYDAALFPATAHGKNIAPRVAALLDVMQISDILSVESATRSPGQSTQATRLPPCNHRMPKKSSPFAVLPLQKPKPPVAQRKSKLSPEAAMRASPASCRQRSPSRNDLS